MNTTEKYIKKAVEEAKKEFGGHTLSGCNVTMTVDTTIAADRLANALLTQARANEIIAEAMLMMAGAIEPKSLSAIKITNDVVKVGE